MRFFTPHWARSSASGSQDLVWNFFSYFEGFQNTFFKTSECLFRSYLEIAHIRHMLGVFWFSGSTLEFSRSFMVCRLFLDAPNCFSTFKETNSNMRTNRFFLLWLILKGWHFKFSGSALWFEKEAFFLLWLILKGWHF